MEIARVSNMIGILRYGSGYIDPELVASGYLKRRCVRHLMVYILAVVDGEIGR